MSPVNFTNLLIQFLAVFLTWPNSLSLQAKMEALALGFHVSIPQKRAHCSPIFILFVKE